jgi:hypothetical protein
MPDTDSNDRAHVKGLLTWANTEILNALNRVDVMGPVEVAEIKVATDGLLRALRNFHVHGTASPHYDPSVDRVFATGDLAKMKALEIEVGKFLKNPANSSDINVSLAQYHLIEEIKRLERTL